MAPTTTIPASASRGKRSFSDVSPEELITELQNRDALIAELEGQCKKLKKTAATTKPAAAVAAAAVSPVDPAKAEAGSAKLKKIAVRGIKSQMKWKPSLKHGTGRWSWSALCDEATFRVFMGLQPKDKTKGGKVPIDKFESLVGTAISASIRYGSLQLVKENVNVTYNKNDGEIKITGAYGMRLAAYISFTKSLLFVFLDGFGYRDLRIAS